MTTGWRKLIGAIYLCGVQAWTTDLEFAYEHGHLYLLDGTRHWSDGDRVDLRMPADAGFFQPLRIEASGAKPGLDLDGWEHVAEFSLDLGSGTLALASGSCEAIKVQIEPGPYRARWSARADGYRLQLWPGASVSPRFDLKRRNGDGNDLGDVPALLTDEGVQAVGTIIGTSRAGDALRVDVRLSAWASRVWDRAIRCDGVVRWRATSEPFGHALLHAEHPGLLPYSDERGGLSFRGRPSEPERLEHALRAAHAEAAGEHIPFEDGIATRLSIGYGRLASGPVTLLRRYASVAGRHGLATNLTITGPGRAGLSLLELGDSFVVAERFSVS
jgi:hypothetical protein